MIFVLRAQHRLLGQRGTQQPQYARHRRGARSMHPQHDQCGSCRWPLAVGVDAAGVVALSLHRVLTLAPRRPRTRVAPPQTGRPDTEACPSRHAFTPKTANSHYASAPRRADNLLEKSPACKRTSLNVAQLRQVLPFLGRIFAGIAGSRFYAVDCADMILMTAMQPSRGNMSNASAYARRC